MNYNDIFNEKTCNIFCDGSIKKNEMTGETIGSPGCVVVLNLGGMEMPVESPTYILRNCTNNMTENRSLLMGIYSAIKYAKLGYDVNVFGDSQYCIYGITRWIFDWVKCIHNGVMYNSSGNPVKNQEFIKELVLTVYYGGVNINFYHQKGHVLTLKYNEYGDVNLDDYSISPKMQADAERCFKQSNGIKFVDPYFIERIAVYNDLCDKITKFTLDQFSQTREYNIRYPENLVLPATFELTNVDMNVYSNLIKRRRRYV